MSTPAKLDPAALVPGQRVRLYCEQAARRKLSQETVFEYAVDLDWYFSDAIFGDAFSVILTAHDDGTLRDSEWRVVEVRDGE